MSGGYFEYNQYKIDQMKEDIRSLLERQGKEKDKDELWNTDEFYEKYPEEKLHPTYPPEVVKILKDGIKYLELAYVYAHRIDWFLSGDDGEESLQRRLQQELEKLEFQDD